VADFASGVVDTDISSVSASDDTLASAKAIKTYVDDQVSAVSTTSISEGNSSVDVDDGAGGAGQVVINIDGNNELVINDTSATFSGNVIMSGDLTVNGTTTTVATTNTTVADNIIELKLRHISIKQRRRYIDREGFDR
jgi:N-acetylglucosamine-6-phosphate deacetylase